jgi:hypothetical protein
VKELTKQLPKGKCKGCGADIYWIRTHAGRLMPVNTTRKLILADAKDSDTTIVTDKGEVVTGKQVENGFYTDYGYESHFATCPAAAEYRRKKDNQI